MKINQNRSAEKLTFTLEGRLDTTTAPELETVINGMDDAVKDLVIDMKGVEYISSAGLRVLLAAQKKMDRIGTLKLVGVCDSVMEVFEMTGFSDILVIE